MNISDTAEAAHRVASAATSGGATISIGSGASIGVVMFLGFTPAQWQVIGVAGGLLIGVIGLVCNLAVSIYFKSQEMKMFRAKLEESDDVGS